MYRRLHSLLIATSLVIASSAYARKPIVHSKGKGHRVYIEVPIRQLSKRRIKTAIQRRIKDIRTNPVNCAAPKISKCDSFAILKFRRAGDIPKVWIDRDRYNFKTIKTEVLSKPRWQEAP